MNSCVPKVFWLDYAAPVGIECYCSLRSDAFAPVIFIGETAARPAHVRHLYPFERSDDITANPPRVRNFGVGADPDAFVDAMAEVFGKLAEYVAVDLRARFGCVDGYLDFLRYRHRNSYSEKSQAKKK
jgi:hypothetical protein